MTVPRANESGRTGWDGLPLPDRYYEIHEAVTLAQQHVRSNADADRAFGGDGSASFDDSGSRAADALVFLAREMHALGSSLISHGEKIGDDTTVKTGQAILDHLPERDALYA